MGVSPVQGGLGTITWVALIAEDVEIRIDLEGIGSIKFDACIEVPPTRTIECRVFAEISQAIEDCESPDGIVSRIHRRATRIVRMRKRGIGIVENGVDHIDAVGTRHRRPEVSRRVEISLSDAMNRPAKSQGVPIAVGGTAIVASKEIALDGLAWSQDAGPDFV